MTLACSLRRRYSRQRWWSHSHSTPLNPTPTPICIACQVAAPAFVGRRMRAAYVAAERDAARRGACVVKHRHEPRSLVRPVRFPYNPPACCVAGEGHIGTRRRPCTDAITADQSCGDETFCGATKGVCTATCTCAGDNPHGRVGTTGCSLHCCKYWHKFWRANGRSKCSQIGGPRPLKTFYCDRGRTVHVRP